MKHLHIIAEESMVWPKWGESFLELILCVSKHDNAEIHFETTGFIKRSEPEKDKIKGILLLCKIKCINNWIVLVKIMLPCVSIRRWY